MSILYGTKINQLLANTAPTGLLFARRKAIQANCKRNTETLDY